MSIPPNPFPNAPARPNRDRFTSPEPIQTPDDAKKRNDLGARIAGGFTAFNDWAFEALRRMRGVAGDPLVDGWLRSSRYVFSAPSRFLELLPAIMSNDARTRNEALARVGVSGVVGGIGTGIALSLGAASLGIPGLAAAAVVGAVVATAFGEDAFKGIFGDKLSDPTFNWTPSEIGKVMSDGIAGIAGRIANRAGEILNSTVWEPFKESVGRSLIGRAGIPAALQPALLDEIRSMSLTEAQATINQLVRNLNEAASEGGIAGVTGEILNQMQKLLPDVPQGQIPLTPPAAPGTTPATAVPGPEVPNGGPTAPQSPAPDGPEGPQPNRNHPWLPNWLWPVLNPFNRAAGLICPLVIDLDRDGVELVSLQSSRAYFDLANNGFARLTGWVGRERANDNVVYMALTA